MVDPGDDASEKAAVRREVAILRRRERWTLDPWDGVLGTPPKPVPRWHCDIFADARRSLLEPTALRPAFTVAQLRAMLEQYELHGKPPGTLLIARDRDALGVMVTVRYALPRPEAECLAILGDDRGAKLRAGQSRAGKTRKRHSVAAAVRAQWEKLAKVPERDRSAIIARRLSVSEHTVRGHVRKLGLRKAEGK